MIGLAVISQCGRFRYRLERNLGAGRTAAVIMVNPSTADADNDDHSIRKVKGFAKRLGVGHIIVGNKFAFRATDIQELRFAADPIGPDNDRYLEQIFRDSDLHIIAWGRLSKLPPHLRTRWVDVMKISRRVGCKLFCFGCGEDGQPKHPLMLSYNTPLTEWVFDRGL